MKRSFASVGIGAASFWSPSLGPTSYTRTSRSAIGVMGGGDLAENLPTLDLLPLGNDEAQERAVGRRSHGVLHLHRLDHDDYLARRGRRAFGDEGGGHAGGRADG